MALIKAKLINLIKRRLKKSVNADKQIAYDLIRIYLGIVLFLKGIEFIANPMALSELMQGSQLQFVPMIMIHYIALSHLVGGVLLIIGLLTRIAALVQIPILTGAVFLVHLSANVSSVQHNFEFAVLILFLLIIYAVLGAGKYSVDVQVMQKK